MAPFKQIEVVDNILDEVFLIMKQLKIRTFLAFGTCLGFVRDRGYVQGDHDLDLGIICNWREMESLVKIFRANGFIVRRTIPKNRHIHFIKDKTLVDIYFFPENTEFYSKFDYVQYKNKEYPVPHPVEEYLSRCYSNWKVKENEPTHYHVSYIDITLPRTGPLKKRLNPNRG